MINRLVLEIPIPGGDETQYNITNLSICVFVFQLTFFVNEAYPDLLDKNPAINNALSPLSGRQVDKWLLADSYSLYRTYKTILIFEHEFI